MLKDVLRILDRGEVLRKEEVAAEAGIDVSVLEGVLDFLVKRDYIREVCGDPAMEKCNCVHCGSHGFCVDSGKTYVVTEKGKRLAHNNVSKG